MRILFARPLLGSMIAGVVLLAASAPASAQAGPASLNIKLHKERTVIAPARDERIPALAEWPSDPPRLMHQSGPFKIGGVTAHGSTLQNGQRSLQQEIEPRTRGLFGVSLVID